MSNTDNHAIHAGGTPLNTSPDPDELAHNVHAATEDTDAVEATYVDPVTIVNHAAPVTEAMIKADEAGE